MGTAQARLSRLYKDNIVFAVDNQMDARQRFSAEFHVPVADSLENIQLHANFSQIDLIWITVTDAEISHVSQQLAGLLNTNTVVLNTSGALSCDAIARYMTESA